jgi:RNA polymerase sigma factor (sigma-70 family)
MLTYWGRGPQRQAVIDLTHLPPPTRLLDMESMAGTSDTDLAGVMRSAMSGDEVAFGQIVVAYNDDMRRVCLVITRDEPLADDAVQAAWAIAWKKLGSVREPDRLKAWLVSVAANQARDLLRKNRRRNDIEVGERMAPIVSGGIDPATGIESLDMLAAVERLDADDRALLAMRYVAGFDATELSVALGISPAGTRTRLKRLIDRLRQELV